MEILRDDGTRLYWTCSGDGPPIVLSHGWLADHRLFDRLTPTLVSAGYRVIRWDVRAHGRSSRGNGPTTFDGLVGDLAAVLAKAKVERPILVGHDLGAQLSLGLASTQPDLRGLSLWSVDTSRVVTHRARQALLTAAQHVTIRPLVLGLEAVWFRRNPAHDAGLATLLRRSATALSAAALREVATAPPPDFSEIVNRLTIPVQVLWGEADLLVRPQAGKELLSRLRTGVGQGLPDAAHQLVVDQPDRVAELLLSWLSSVGASE